MKRAFLDADALSDLTLTQLEPEFLISEVFRRSRRRSRSCSKLPQMACNKESAEKSADPEGEFL